MLKPARLQRPLALLVVLSLIASSVWKLEQKYSEASTATQLRVKNASIPDAQELILYLKLQKTGSVTMEYLLGKALAGKGYAIHKHANGPINLVKKAAPWHYLSEDILRTKPPALISQFMYYVRRLKSGGSRRLVLISLMRNPIERFVSFYHYIRFKALPWGRSIFHSHFRKHFKSYEAWKHQDINECLERSKYDCQMHRPVVRAMYLSLPHYCGSASICVNESSLTGYERAVNHIEADFVVLGVLERLEDTVKVMARAVPALASIGDVYDQESITGSSILRNPGRKKSVLSERSKQILSRALAMDLKLYEFANLRLDRQLREMKQIS